MTATTDLVPLVVSALEAAQLLGVGENTIYRWLDKGALPELPRVGRRRLIPRRAIDLLIEQTMHGFDPATLLDEMRAAS